jgi:hypothetical protein
MSETVLHPIAVPKWAGKLPHAEMAGERFGNATEDQGEIKPIQGKSSHFRHSRNNLLPPGDGSHSNLAP